MNTSEGNTDFDLIVRYLSGESSPEDLSQFNTWLNSDEDNRRQFEEFKAVWKKMDRVSPIVSLDIDAEWKYLESRMEESLESFKISPEDSIPKSMVEKSGAVKAGKSRSMVFLASRIAIAAVIVFALVFGGLYTSRNVGYSTLMTADLAEEVELPDGSTIFLNSNSSIKYPKRFNKLQRDVSLKGEGFFEVNGDPDWPFVITTAELDIRVLGTSFNVNAYESNNEVEVVVKTGQVAVTRHGDVPKTIILKPGSKAVFNKSEENLRLSTRIDKNYLAWKTKSFVFEDESLANVVNALNKVYASEILIPSDSLKEARITSTFNDQSLEAILNVLSATLDIEVQMAGEQILLKEFN